MEESRWGDVYTYDDLDICINIDNDETLNHL